MEYLIAMITSFICLFLLGLITGMFIWRKKKEKKPINIYGDKK